MVLGRAHQHPQRRPMDLACHHLETRRQGRQAKRWRDSWTNTGATRSGRGQHTIGLTWRRHAEAFAQPRDTMAVLFVGSMMRRLVFYRFLSICWNLHFFAHENILERSLKNLKLNSVLLVQTLFVNNFFSTHHKRYHLGVV